jgi:hypothetical protein
MLGSPTLTLMATPCAFTVSHAAAVTNASARIVLATSRNRTAMVSVLQFRLSKAEVHQLRNLFARQITEIADAFKSERFIRLCFFFRHRSVFRASWRARVFVDSAAAICLRNYHRKRPCLLTTSAD